MELLSSLNIINIEPTHQQIYFCKKLIDEHLKWNKIYNLSAHRCFDDVLIYQVIDSLSISTFIKPGKLLDIGTGPGFPGLPLAIFHPKTQFTLLDANDKKLAFARQIKSILNLVNVTILHKRIENMPTNLFFDQIMSRAFTDLNSMIECSLSRLSPNGQILAMKGARAEDELAIAKTTYNKSKMWLEKLPHVVNQQRVLAIVQ